MWTVEFNVFKRFVEVIVSHKNMQVGANGNVDSLTFVLSGKSSELVCSFNPTIYLDGEYEMCMINLQSYNSIANVTSYNNVFRYKNGEEEWKEIIIPEGAYDVDDLQSYIEEELKKKEGDDIVFYLKGNTNTMRVTMETNVDVDFGAKYSIGTLCGFDKVVVYRGKRVASNRVVDINEVNAIDILCNIVDGSFINGSPSHILYHFYPNVPPGFKIIEVPEQKIYMPVNTNVLSSISIRLVDQDGRPVNFRGEEVTIYLRLRRRGTN